MEQDTHYLIEIPPRVNGIYIIMNLIEKSAYVGLAKNLANRTMDHFKAICYTMDGKGVVADSSSSEEKESEEINWLDNKELLGEENREFLHIPIYISQKKLDDEKLRNTETAYICMVRDSGFALYNTAKKNWPLDAVKDKVDCEALLRELNEKLESIIGHDLKTLGQMEKQGKEVNEIWSALVKKWGGVNRYTLTKCGSSERYLNDPNYIKVYNDLYSFCISKEKLNALFPQDKNKKHKIFKEMSIRSEKLRPFLRNRIVISNFGTHNGESPYEILVKKALDIDQCGCAYWAYKKSMEGHILASVNAISSDTSKRSPAYILFKTTTSDNSRGVNPMPDLEASKAIEVIQRENEEKRKRNATDLKHAYYDESGRWVLFPKDMSAVTSPKGDGKFESKSVAFKISNLWLCEENFDINNLKNSGKVKALTSSGETGTMPSFAAKFDDSFFNEELNLPVTDDTQVIIAELAYPYVVPISHVPDIELFFQCRDNMEAPIGSETEGDQIGNLINSPRILIETRSGNVKESTNILSAVALLPEIVDGAEDPINKAWVIHPEKDHQKTFKIKDILYDDNKEIWEECKRSVLDHSEDGYEGVYHLDLQLDKKSAKLLITAKNHDKLVIDLSGIYDAEKPLYPNDGDKYGYYKLPQDNGTQYLVRYLEKKVGDLWLPPFTPYSSK